MRNEKGRGNLSENKFKEIFASNVLIESYESQITKG